MPTAWQWWWSPWTSAPVQLWCAQRCNKCWCAPGPRDLSTMSRVRRYGPQVSSGGKNWHTWHFGQTEQVVQLLHTWHCQESGKTVIISDEDVLKLSILCPPSSQAQRLGHWQPVRQARCIDDVCTETSSGPAWKELSICIHCHAGLHLLPTPKKHRKMMLHVAAQPCVARRRNNMESGIARRRWEIWPIQTLEI